MTTQNPPMMPANPKNLIKSELQALAEFFKSCLQTFNYQNFTIFLQTENPEKTPCVVLYWAGMQSLQAVPTFRQKDGDKAILFNQYEMMFLVSVFSETDALLPASVLTDFELLFPFPDTRQKLISNSKNVRIQSFKNLRQEDVFYPAEKRLLYGATAEFVAQVNLRREVDQPAICDDPAGRAKLPEVVLDFD